MTIFFPPSLFAPFFWMYFPVKWRPRTPECFHHRLSQSKQRTCTQTLPAKSTFLIKVFLFSQNLFFSRFLFFRSFVVALTVLLWIISVLKTCDSSSLVFRWPMNKQNHHQQHLVEPVVFDTSGLFSPLSTAHPVSSLACLESFPLALAFASLLAFNCAQTRKCVNSR